MNVFISYEYTYLLHRIRGFFNKNYLEYLQMMISLKKKLILFILVNL
jgi:hypothetical protein